MSRAIRGGFLLYIPKIKKKRKIGYATQDFGIFFGAKIKNSSGSRKNSIPKPSLPAIVCM